MGHSICIIDIEDGRFATELNFNWPIYESIFHIQETHGHIGKTVEVRLEEVLKELKKRVEDKSNADLSSDEWSHGEVGEFVKVLQELHSVAVEYYDCYWYVDQTYSTIPLHGVTPMTVDEMDFIYEDVMDLRLSMLGV